MDMTKEQKEEADRNYNNFSTMAQWTAQLNKEQVNYIFQNRGDYIYCHGHLRTIVAEQLTNDSFKVFTKPFGL